MQVANLVNNLKNTSLQNIAQDFYDTSDWIFVIKWWLDYLFGSINRKRIWYYTSVEETLSPEPNKDNKVFKTTHTIQWFIKDKKTNNTWVYTDSYSFNRKNFFVDDLKWYYFTVGWDENGINIITLSQPVDALKVRYRRWPRIPTVDDLTTNVDIPSQLESALKMYCLWQVFPLYLENGAQLSQYYFNQMNIELDNYIQTIGENIDQDGFSTE